MFDGNLYIDPAVLPEMEKRAADVILGEPASWEHEITRHMYEKVPFLSKYNTVLQFHRRDDKAGYAYGSLVVQNAITIPIIIRQERGKTVLAPLDTFNYQGKWLPLTTERVDRILFNSQIFERLVRPEEEVARRDQQLGSVLRPPSDGKEIIASQTSIMDAILPLTKKAYIKRVIDEIDNDPKLLAGFSANQTFGVIRKIATYLYESPEKQLEPDDLPLNIAEITKTASGYKVTYISDSAYAPVTKEMTSLGMRSAFGDDILKLASNQGHCICEFNREPTDLCIIDDLGKDRSRIIKHGSYSVHTQNGREVEGCVLNVVDFDCARRDEMLFLSKVGHIYDPIMLGASATVDENEIVKEADARAGVKSAFVLDNAFATIPFTIASPMIKHASGVRFLVRDQYNKEYSLVYTPEVTTIEKFGNDYYVPTTMKLVELGPEMKSETSMSEIEKRAKLEKAGADKLTVKWSGLQYAITGMPETEALHANLGLSKTAAKSFLVKMGASVDNAQVILDRAVKNPVTVSGFRSLVPFDGYFEKVASAALNPKCKYASSMRQNTIKLAATVADEDSVDKILSLNFITPQNIEVFASYIPQFEECVSNLSSILIAARLGLREIQELPVKQAIQTLDVVATQLKDMFAIEDALRGVSDTSQ